MLGVKRIERLLPTGTPLTVVGNWPMARWGSGLPSRIPHMSDKPVDQLIANLGKWSRWYKCASMGLTVFGVYLIAKHAFQYLMERKRHWKMRKRVLAAAAKRAGKEEEGVNGKVENISDTAKKDKMMQDLCVICLEQEYNVVFIPPILEYWYWRREIAFKLGPNFTCIFLDAVSVEIKMEARVHETKRTMDRGRA